MHVNIVRSSQADYGQLAKMLITLETDINLVGGGILVKMLITLELHVFFSFIHLNIVSTLVLYNCIVSEPMNEEIYISSGCHLFSAKHNRYGRPAPVIKTMFHQCVISYTCSEYNSVGSVFVASLTLMALF